MDTIIKMVTGQKASTAVVPPYNATLVTNKPKTNGSGTVQSDLTNNNNTNAHTTSAAQIGNLLRKRPKARGAALFHTSHGQLLRPTVTAVSIALAKSTNISTRGRPSV